MSSDKVPVCRLCLEIVYDGKFQEVESIIIVLQNMLPELNFSVSSQPVICNKCTETIQKLFSFKSACLETEKYLQHYRPSENSTIYLEDAVYNNTLENKIKMEKTDKGKICRFCLQILEGDLCTQLGVLEEDMLGKCLAELDLTITDNPIICGTCLESLQNQFNFIISCLDVEARINNYCSMQTNSDDPVNLHDVLTLQKPVDKIDHSNSFNGYIGVKVKLEDYDHSQNAESFKKFEQIFTETEVKSESTLEANLDIFDEVIPKNHDESVTKKLPHELDHDYSYIIQPSLNKGLVNTSRLSKNYRMKHFIRPRKEVRTVQNLKKTILQLERKLKYYKQKYRRVSKRLYNLHCVLEELRNKNLISKEVYEKILTGI